MELGQQRHIAGARAELDQKQRKLVELSLFPERDITGTTLELGLLGKVFLTADLKFIGSRGLESGTWLWAWMNESLVEGEWVASEAVQKYCEIHSLDVLARDQSISIDENTAWNFAALAIDATGALGVHRESNDNTDWFFAVEALHRAEPAETYWLVIEHLVNETVVEGGSARKINWIRETLPQIHINVIEADLRGKAERWAHDLNVQPLFELFRGLPANINGPVTKRKFRNLSGVDLHGARLDGSNLRGLELSNASFADAVLIDADFTRAVLRDASFRNAKLTGCNFTGALLDGADFSGAELGGTLFARVDLSKVRGLDTVHHVGPSEIPFSTLVESSYQISRAFLRATGVSRGLLDDLERGKRFPKRYQTCFLSYSTCDVDVVGKIYGGLTKAGVRVFWDQKDILPGDVLRKQIVGAIREHDRIVIVLSQASMASKWVREELAQVWHAHREKLIPVRICPIGDIEAWIASDDAVPNFLEDVRVADFSKWNDPKELDRRMELLIRSLRG